MDKHISLGIDTSNYTTSLALFDGREMRSERKLLPVAEGQRGLRQSDAVFHHTRQLPEMAERLSAIQPTLIAVSDKPTEEDGSYMPCFLAGAGLARSLSALGGLPLYRFTHQQGHVAAALYGAGQTDWIGRRFLAFHVSGGTTDGLLVEPSDDTVISCRRVATSLDLKAGQLIDRTGVAMGLSFPAGAAMDALLEEAPAVLSVKPSMEGANCHLSGVENQTRALIEKGAAPRDVAHLCFSFVYQTISAMTERLIEEYGDLPILYAGGVMSSRYLSRLLEKRFGGKFAPPAYSADNAAGIAFLGYIKDQL